MAHLDADDPQSLLKRFLQEARVIALRALPWGERRRTWYSGLLDFYDLEVFDGGFRLRFSDVEGYRAGFLEVTGVLTAYQPARQAEWRSRRALELHGDILVRVSLVRDRPWLGLLPRGPKFEEVRTPVLGVLDRSDTLSPRD